MKTKIIIGIITSKKNYSENDEMLTVLIENSLIYIYAKGTRKIESKNRANVVLGALSNFEVFENSSSPNSFLLKKATLISSFPEVTKTNSKKIEELIKIFKNIRNNKNQIFNICNLLISDFNSNNFYKYRTFLISKILLSDGESLSFSFCAFCFTNQNLFSFDVSLGGMLCKKHGKIKTDINLLKSFYALGQNIEKYIEITSTENNQTIFNVLSSLLF